MIRLLLTLLALSACAPSPTPSADPPTETDPASPGTPFASEADYRQQVAQALVELEAAVRTGATKPGSCMTIMHSEQACGGLTDWVVLSSETSDTTEVRRLADHVTALTRKANAQFEWASTCMAYLAPPTTLQDGQCVAVE